MAGSSRSTCARGTNGPTASPSPPRISASSGRMSPPTRISVQRCRHPAPGRGEPPKVEVLDELTVRWSWSKPNRFFIPALAAANQLFIYRPAHYLKQFPPEIRRSRAVEEADRRERCARLDPAVPAQGPAQRLRQSGDADAAALAPGDPAARAALRGRAQPLPIASTAAASSCPTSTSSSLRSSTAS